MQDPKKLFRRRIIVTIVIIISLFTIVGLTNGVRILANDEKVAESGGQTGLVNSITSEQAGVTKFAFIAAAIAFGLGAIGAGIAIGNVGSAAMGAIAEKPEVAGQALIFVALAEGLVIFGFITALMILGKV